MIIALDILLGSLIFQNNHFDILLAASEGLSKYHCTSQGQMANFVYVYLKGNLRQMYSSRYYQKYVVGNTAVSVYS